MISKELVGRRVKVIAWYDHAELIAAHPRPTQFEDGPEGTVTHVGDHTGEVSVHIDGHPRVFAFKFGDVEVLP